MERKEPAPTTRSRLLNCPRPPMPTCGSKRWPAGSSFPWPPRWSSCHHSRWRLTACSPKQSPTQTQAPFSQRNHPFRKLDKGNPERPTTSRFCPKEHASSFLPHYFDLSVFFGAGAAVAGILGGVFSVLSVFGAGWGVTAPPVLPVAFGSEDILPAPVGDAPVALEGFLVQPTVPTPIMNAKQRTSNPRSLCTVFPSFPRNPRIVEVGLPNPHSRQVNNYDALLIDLFPAGLASRLKLSRSADFGRLRLATMKTKTPGVWARLLDGPWFLT